MKSKPRRKKKVKVVERKLGREGAWGLCWSDGNLIEIDPRQKGKKRFSTLVHEGLHKCFPGLSEAQVIQAEKLMADILWNDGYRRVDQ